MNGVVAAILIALPVSALVALVAWASRHAHRRHHPGGTRGFLRDCALNGVSVFLVVGGVLALEKLLDGGWKYAAIAGWGLAVILFVTKTPLMRDARKNLMLVDRARR